MPANTGRIYRKIGDWLSANTSADSLVAVTEVGVIGYFADRPMVDLLGILRPDIGDALGRGDLTYTIPHYMPDYIVLGSNLDTFGARFDKDKWFLSNYEPVARITADEWGLEPQVIVKRTAEKVALETHNSGQDFGSKMTLEDYAINSGPLRRGDGIRVRLDWQRQKDMNQRVLVVAYLDGPDGKMAAWADQTLDTALWAANRTISVYHRIYLDPALAPGKYTLGIRMVLEDQTNIIHKLGPLEVR